MANTRPAPKPARHSTHPARSTHKRQPQPGPGRGHKEDKTAAPRGASVFTGDPSPTRAEACKTFNTSRKKHAQAAKVMKARPDLAEKVHAGEIKLSDAEREIKREEVRTNLEDIKQKELIKARARQKQISTLKQNQGNTVIQNSGERIRTDKDLIKARAKTNQGKRTTPDD